MSEPDDLLELPLGELLARLASDAPTPAGGALAAITAAGAAAMVEMGATLTLRHERYRAAWPDMEAARTRAAELRVELVRLVDEDARAYAGVIEAMRLPQGDDAARDARAAALADALVAAARPPLAMLGAAAEIAELAAGRRRARQRQPARRRDDGRAGQRGGGARRRDPGRDRRRAEPRARGERADGARPRAAGAGGRGAHPGARGGRRPPAAPLSDRRPACRSACRVGARQVAGRRRRRRAQADRRAMRRMRLVAELVSIACDCGASGEAPIGALVECECGRTFTAEGPPAEHVATIAALERRHRVLQLALADRPGRALRVAAGRARPQRRAAGAGRRRRRLVRHRSTAPAAPPPAGALGAARLARRRLTWPRRVPHDRGARVR